MGAVFSKLVHISLMANWLILAVIVLRMLLKGAPRKIICILWALVALRLILPFSIESPVSMIPQTTSVIQEAVDTNLIHPETVLSGTAQAPVPEGPKTVVESSQSRVPVVPIVWCAGSFLMLSYLLFSYIRMRHLVVEAIPEADGIWICDSVTTPFILGLLRPRIYLPSGLYGQTRAYVIAHEQSHLCRKDHWWKPLAFVLLSIYWFDPFVWIAYVLVCRDIEFACDEKVIHRFNITEKKGYSAALLECSEGKRLVLACPVAFGETAVVQRVRNVLNYKKPRFWLILISAGAILVTAVGFLTVPKKQAAPDFQESKPVQDASSATTPTALAQSTTVPTTPTEEINLNDEWADFPDGIHIESYKGETFTAHIMVIRNPANVYLATSTDDFSTETPGIPMDAAMEQENAVAAINASYFNDDGSGSLAVGSLPCGLVLSHSTVVWNKFHDLVPERGFVGFNQDNILIVSDDMTAEEANALGIRDGCAGGPILMINGKPVEDIYNGYSGYNPRTAIGQRADGAVLFVCAEGRNSESLGATYADVIRIMEEYEAVNACMLRVDSASNMLYQDVYGRYGEAGQTLIFNPLYGSSAITFRRMPTFWMVKSTN